MKFQLKSFATGALVTATAFGLWLRSTEVLITVGLILFIWGFFWLVTNSSVRSNPYQ